MQECIGEEGLGQSKIKIPSIQHHIVIVNRSILIKNSSFAKYA